MHGAPASPELQAARRQWMSSTPSRASAWSAGLVGALLATGLVLLGTHLTSWLASGAEHARVTLTDVTTTTLSGSQGPGMATAGQTSLARNVATKIAFVEGWANGARFDADGVVVRENGMIAVPAPIVRCCHSLQVTLSDGEQFGDAAVVGIDHATGVAVIHIDDAGLQPLSQAADSSLEPGDWTAIEWATDRHVVLAVGDVRTTRTFVALGGGPALLSKVTTNLFESPSMPRGAVIVNASGAFVGFVTVRHGSSLLEVPAYLVDRIATDLIADGKVVHGWLGIRGVTSHEPVPPPASVGHEGGRSMIDGVRVTTVMRGGAAAVAGLRPGDMIVAVDGELVRTMDQLEARLYLLQPGQTVDLRVDRDGHTWHCAPLLRPAA